MRVNVYPVDDTGTGNYRLRFPARALIDQGYDVHIKDDTICEAMFKQDGGQVTLAYVDEDTLPECDVIVVQRVASPTLALTLEYMRNHGYRVVVDTDDDIHSISHGNLAKAEWRGKERVWAFSMRMADVVTCSTERLHRRTGGIVLPNCVPEWYLSVDEPQTRHVGWTGTIQVHPYDLQVVGDAVMRFSQQAEVPFRVVGEAEGVAEALGLPVGTVPETGWLPIEDYPQAVAKLGMGIVPLEPTSFNDSKSWLKGLEYAALGVPFVASPVAEYVKLYELGIGKLARRPRDWVKMLHQVWANRDEERAINRERAAAWTYESRAELWWEAWTKT